MGIDAKTGISHSEKPASVSQIKLALQDSIPVILGYIPLGMGMGMTLGGTDIDWWWAFIFAVFMYAGSMQYLIVPMIAAHESLIAIALATVLIQFRHVFYGISFPLDLIRSKFARLYAIHALTDEVYAVISSRDRSQTTGLRVIWTQIFCHSAWIIGCSVGALVGLAVPINERILNFVLTSLFVILMIESYRANRRKVEMVIAAVLAGICLILPSTLFLPITLSVLTLILVLASNRFSKLGSRKQDVNLIEPDAKDSMP